jgi:hypothetical protein
MDMNVHVLINLFHIILVAPFLIWIGVSRANTDINVYTFLFALGLFIIVYHGYKSYAKYMLNSSSIWVNLIHMVWIGPLLAYIGYRKKDTERSAYELLLLTAFGALGYHLYELAVYTT